MGGILIMYTFKTDYETPYLIVVGKVVLTLVVLGWPNIFRLMRSSVLQVNPLEYVQAARALGASPWRVINSHIIPNSLTPVIVVSTIDLGAYIATEASLSFLGMGAQPPTPEWGAMLNEARADMMTAPHVAIFPAVAIFLTVLAFNLLGDGLRLSLIHI